MVWGFQCEMARAMYLRQLRRPTSSKCVGKGCQYLIKRLGAYDGACKHNSQSSGGEREGGWLEQRGTTAAGAGFGCVQPRAITAGVDKLAQGGA